MSRRSLVHLAGKWEADRAAYLPACGWPVPVRMLTKEPLSVTCRSCMRSKVYQALCAGVAPMPEPVLPGRRWEPDF